MAVRRYLTTNNNREFFVSGYTVQYLKSIVSQAKVYVRPMQKDLDLTPLMADKDEFVYAKNYNHVIRLESLQGAAECTHCGSTVPLQEPLGQLCEPCILIFFWHATTAQGGPNTQS